MGMLILTNPKGETCTIAATDVETTRTLGSLSTISFNFVATGDSKKGALFMNPFTTVTVPETRQQFLITNNNPSTLGDSYSFAVTGIGVGHKLAYTYHTKKLLNKTKGQKYKLSLDQCLKHVFYKSGCSYVIEDKFEDHPYKDGFGKGHGDDLLKTLSKDFGFEYYFSNTICHITKKVGYENSFAFVIGINYNKINIQRDYSKITTTISAKGNPKKTTKTVLKQVLKKAYTKHLKGKTTTKIKTPTTTTTTKKTKKTKIEYTFHEKYVSPRVKELGWPEIRVKDSIFKDCKDINDFHKKVVNAVHDYPDIQITIDGVNFKKKNKIKNPNDDRNHIGSTGIVRDRGSIDIVTRIKQIKEYPQDPNKNDVITLNNYPLRKTQAQLQVESRKEIKKIKENAQDQEERDYQIVKAMSKMLDKQERQANRIDKQSDKVKALKSANKNLSARIAAQEEAQKNSSKRK